MSEYAVERARQIFRAKQTEQGREARSWRLAAGETPADPDDGGDAGDLIGALHRVHSRIRHLDGWLREEHQLSLTEMHVLSRIPAVSSAQRTAGRGKAAARLAKEVELSPSGLTRLVDRLVTRGLVARVDDVWDRRVTHLVLTDRGRMVRDAVLPQAVERIRAGCGADDVPLERLRWMVPVPWADRTAHADGAAEARLRG
jgi:DNA-binding MarR family transcriptional regulator